MTKVLISGAGIAGQVAAFWLARAGWDCIVVERFDALRRGGQNVDIRGAARSVIERMGLADAVSGFGTGEVGTRFVDEHDRSLAEFPEDGSAGGGATAEWEILRSQLTELFFDSTRDNLDYRFGRSIAAITERAASGGVSVRFDDGSAEDVDVVVVAEGIGSRTRDRLIPAFADTAVRPLGIAIAYFSIPRSARDDQWWRWFNAPGGRAATLRPDNLGRARATLSFRADEPLPADPGEARALVRRVFAGAGWETARILDGMDATDDLYIDLLGQVRSPRWTTDRVALVGDAGYCPSPVTGMGTSLAIVGGYVLAGELASGAPVPQALARYERILRPYVERAQKLPPGAPGVMHPRSRLGVVALRSAFRLAGSGILRPFERRLFHPPADRFVLPDYSAATSGR